MIHNKVDVTFIKFKIRFKKFISTNFREGASKIFAGDMEDDDMEIDINKILADAEEKSNLAAQDFDKAGDSITKKISLDENYSFSVYDFQGSFKVLDLCQLYKCIISGENWKSEQDRKRIERERIIELPKRERKQTNHDLSKILDQKVSQPQKKKPQKPIPTDKLKKALAEKFAKYSNPQKQLRISPDLSKKYLRKHNTKYSENEDRFLLCKLNEIGIDAENVYDRIKQKIQDEIRSLKSFIRSRSSKQLEQRCNLLLKVIYYEINGTDQQTHEQKSAKKRKILMEKDLNPNKKINPENRQKMYKYETATSKAEADTVKVEADTVIISDSE